MPSHFSFTSRVKPRRIRGGVERACTNAAVRIKRVPGGSPFIFLKQRNKTGHVYKHRQINQLLPSKSLHSADYVHGNARVAHFMSRYLLSF